ncbi:MAG: sugar phosphate isomerase/epimerase, partial [Planctomycetes bacterium]|nr:sugar phosphate isomerase/epimerase [Planctomycetota bacterium]
MKTGFSSQVCPAWDLETILTKAAELSFDGVELRGLRGELNLPLIPELARDPQATRRCFEERGVELVCLAACMALDSKSKRVVGRNKATIVEYIELAGRLGCPYVRIFMGEVQRFDNHRAALARIAEAVRSLVPVASRHNVVLLVENGGDFPGSEGLWFVADAADHPAVRVCWNQCHAMAIRERCSISIPRLSNRISLVHA